MSEDMLVQEELTWRLSPGEQYFAPQLGSKVPISRCSGAKANLSVELGKGGCCLDSGEARLRQLGYKQELARNFGLLSNASIGFTAISILTGITGAPHVHLTAF